MLTGMFWLDLLVVFFIMYVVGTNMEPTRSRKRKSDVRPGDRGRRKRRSLSPHPSLNAGDLRTQAPPESFEDITKHNVSSMQNKRTLAEILAQQAEQERATYGGPVPRVQVAPTENSDDEEMDVQPVVKTVVQTRNNPYMSAITVSGGERGNVTVPIGGTRRIPKPQWVASLSDEQLRVWAVRKALREGSRRGRYRRKGTYRKRYYRRRSGGGNAARPLLISPGTARGMGAYSISGGMEGELFGQKYNVGGYYNSDPVSGLGEYNVKKNSLMGMVDLGTSPPRVMNSSKGEAVIIHHREYIADLISGTGSPATSFNLLSFSNNPGNELLYPFLAPIAQRFQEYEIRGMLVEIKTLSSDYAAALSMGSVFMAADYNVLGPAPQNKQQLENMEYASSCKPSRSLIMPIECDPRNDVASHLYVATNNNYQGGDPRLFDLCNIYIGSQGIPTPSTPIGEIWITYEIALFKPIITTPVSSPSVLSWHAVFNGYTNDKPWGTAQEVQSGSVIGTASDPYGWQILSDDITLSFPAINNKRYLVIFNWVGDASGDVTYPGISLNGDLELIGNAWCGVNVSTPQPYYEGAIQGEQGLLTFDAQLMILVEFNHPTSDPNPMAGSIEIDNTGSLPGTGIATDWGEIFITEVSNNLNYESP